MTVARQFTILTAVPLLVVIVLSAAASVYFSNLSAEGARLVGSLHHTARLSRELAHGNAEQIDLIQMQLARPNAALAEELRVLGFRLSGMYTEYLKLDIGDRERLVVERAKVLQADSSVVAMHIVEHQWARERGDEAPHVRQLYQLQGRIREEFEALNGLQIEKLRGVLDLLNGTAEQGLVIVFVLLTTLLVAATASSIALRRRIVLPIQALVEASDRVRRGDFSARAPAGPTDEFGALTTGFNFMAESLAESYAGLERMVEERTRQLRDAQGQLIRAEKMSAVGLLVSGVAHELNNPLASIKGFADLARMEVAAAGLAPDAVKLLEDVDGQVERCRRIIGDLLQFARHQDPRLEAVDANAIVDHVIRLREYDLATHNVRIVREFDPSNPRLCADRDRLQQVFLNLLNNAHDAIREHGAGGTITVRTRGDADHVTFEFLDTGPGFRDTERAFDPFYTTKAVGQGTGLGLSICLGIVENHGGRITVGNLDTGACVAVRLPVGDLDAHAQARAAGPAGAQLPDGSRPEPAAPARPQALVVDDEPLLGHLQVTYLRKMGIDAAAAATGEDAIDYLRSHRVDVVVSDVRMPGSVDGVKLFEWIQAYRPELTRRFLFLSGDLVGLHVSDFFQQTAVPRLEKPFSFGEYRRQVLRLLESREVRS